jgi:hypothetical protein
MALLKEILTKIRVIVMADKKNQQKENSASKDNNAQKQPTIIKKKTSPQTQVRHNTSRVPDATNEQLRDNSYAGNNRGAFSLPTKVLTVSSPRIASMISHVLSVSRADNIIAGNLMRRGGDVDTNTDKANKLIQSAMDDFEVAIGKAHSLLRTPSRPNRKKQQEKR